MIMMPPFWGVFKSFGIGGVETVVSWLTLTFCVFEFVCELGGCLSEVCVSRFPTVQRMRLKKVGNFISLHPFIVKKINNTAKNILSCINQLNILKVFSLNFNNKLFFK